MLEYLDAMLTAAIVTSTIAFAAPFVQHDGQEWCRIQCSQICCASRVLGCLIACSHAQGCDQHRTCESQERSVGWQSWCSQGEVGCPCVFDVRLLCNLARDCDCCILALSTDVAEGVSLLEVSEDTISSSEVDAL